MHDLKYDCQNIAIITPMARKYMRKYFVKQGSFVPYNMEDLGKKYLIQVLLPGRTKEDIEVLLIGNLLNVKAAKPKRTRKNAPIEKVDENQKFKYARQFFEFIDVNMDIPLPPDVDLQTIKSRIDKGILEIKLEKRLQQMLEVQDNEFDNTQNN